MTSELTFDIPDFTITINIERNGAKVPHTLDIVEAADVYFRLLENVPADEAGNKYIRDMLPQFQLFLKGKGFPPTSHSETTVIIQAVKQAYEVYKKKSADVLRLPDSSDLAMTRSASDLDE
jgi:hypothetical protein